MKVCILEDYNKDTSGKHKFLNRLVKYFQGNGIKMVNNNADIVLHIGRDRKRVKKINTKKIIMRIDGLILNKSAPYEKNNNKILKYINMSDGLIYQGDFCKLAYEKFLKVNKKHACIHNGANPNEFLKRDVKNYYLTFCKWRPHKRLTNVCNGFIDACNKGLDSILYVGGNVEDKDKILHPQIKYIGWQSTEKMKEYLAGAIATIHLSWLDWCPNAMVESIMAGCPIIYSDSGGSSEIGKFGGVLIKDVQWNFKPLELYDPPILSTNEISDALFYAKNNVIQVNRSHLDINHIGEKYVNFFEEVLSCQK
jgi:glycosyltransferase involved in cell wall biosynthesis